MSAALRQTLPITAGALNSWGLPRFTQRGRHLIGTRLQIPGYGTGVVEDVGGAITGRHIDVWMPSHETARRWGRRNLKVTPLP